MGFNSRKDKSFIKGSTYTFWEIVVAPLVDACLVFIECQTLEVVECGALTNLIGRVT